MSLPTKIYRLASVAKNLSRLEMPSNSGVLVAGMHRSGTSYVTSILVKQGFYAGDNLLGAAQTNPGGHFESLECKYVNDQAFAEAGADWDSPPLEVDFSLANKFRATELVTQLAPNGPYVLKDPRLCFTAHLWQSYIKKCSLLCCYRNPANVALSLQKRNGFTDEKSWQLCNSYNEALVKISKAFGHAYWFNFDEVDKSLLSIKALCDRHQISYDPILARDSFVQDWKHNDKGLDCPEACRDIYALMTQNWCTAVAG